MSSFMTSNSSVNDVGRVTPKSSQDIEILDKSKGSKNIRWDYEQLMKAGNYREV